MPETDNPALDAMPHPDSIEPGLNEDERYRLMAPALARVVLRHHNNYHDFGVPKADDEAVEAAEELDHKLSRRYNSSFAPSELAPGTPEEFEYRREVYDARMRWFEERGIDARPTLHAVHIVNLTTEDDLPGYRFQLPNHEDHPLLRMWNMSWTADEDAHAIVMRRDAEASGSINDYVEYERQRSTYIYNETSVDIRNMTHGLVYPMQQELGTWYPHTMYGVLGGPLAEQVHDKVAADEVRHYIAYRDLVKADMHLAVESGDQDYIDHVAATMVHTLHTANFAMPAEGRMENFRRLSALIAFSGIYDVTSIRSMSRRVVKEIDFEEFAKHVKDEHVKAAIDEFLLDIQEDSPGNTKMKQELEAIRDRKLNRVKEGQLRPLIVGHTVEVHTRNPDRSKPPESGEYIDDDNPKEKVKVIAA